MPTQPMLNIHAAGKEYEAFLVIDSIMNETSAGGVRIADDIGLEETRSLAHEMSFKYSLFRLPRGGAKMGIRLSDELGSDERDRALREIGRKLGPIIRRGLYSPAMDMNCGPVELQAIYAGAGIESGEPIDTSFFTAVSVENALEACYEESGTDGVLTLAIEGFGRVAGHLADRLSPDRYRIVAISTLSGAVRNQNGFEARHLAAERRRSGDDFVKCVGGDPIPSEDVLAEPVDVLLPSTRTWVVTRHLADRIRARMIVPIANAPYAEGVVACLQKAGVLCLPGFVTNAGGVFGSSMVQHGMTKAEMERANRESYRPMVRHLVRRARALGMAPVEVAEKVAAKELDSRNRRLPSSGRFARLKRLAARRLPGRLSANKVRQEFAETMRAIIRELGIVTT